MSDKTRKFAASIYLKNQKAVYNFNNISVISDNPVELSKKYSNSNIDELIVFDMSEGGNDAEHEKALDLIKDICKAVDVPVTGAGNVKRMEDIKKLLYAGCKKACLNFSKQENIDILPEVSEKFGRDKIVVCYSNPDSISSNCEMIEKYSDELIYILDSISLEGLNKPASELPQYLLLEEKVADTPVSIFEKFDFADGLSGNLINANIDKINAYKDECIAKGIKISRLEPAFSWAELKKNSDGMVPVIVQDYRTDQILMLAYMNEEAYNKTLSTGKMTYFSRSRNELWIKGETSSHYQYVMSLTADCDLDTILAKVKQIGAACHTGSYSCFFNEIAKKDYREKNPQKVLDSVFDVIKDRQIHPREGSYTNYLFDKGLDKILKKVGEEATEMVIAAKNPNSNEIVYEMSDFLYHMMVLMAEKNVSWEDVTDELSRR